MARPLLFLTTNIDKYEEIADLFDEECGVEVERRTARLPFPSATGPGDVAKFRALEAFKVLRAPVFAEALSIELPDAPLSGASFRQAFEMPEGGAWLTKHDGHTGIARVCVGYTADGREAKLFEVAIKGKLLAKPRGDGNAPWERFWLPDGKTETLAELAGPDADDFQNAPYLALAKELGSAPASAPQTAPPR